MAPESIRITVRIPQDLVEKIDSLLATGKYGKTTSDLIRRALEAFIETEMSPENVEKKLVDLPKSSVKVLEDLTEQGEYVSVEDAIRAVIRDYVKNTIKENEGEKE